MSKKGQTRPQISFARKLRFFTDKLISFIKIMIIIVSLCFLVYFYQKYEGNILGKLFEKILLTQEKNYNLTLKNIYIEGQHYTSDQDLLDAVKIKIGESIFSRSVNDIKIDLEKIDWVKFAVVERQFSGDLYLGIQERKPIGLGQYNQELFIFDENGKKIHYKNLKDFLHLPIVISEDVNLYVSSLYPIISSNPSLYSKITSVIRVGERRWNVRFDNDLEIKLPENDVSKAWDKVLKLYKENKLFNNSIICIDLRVNNRIFIEKKK